MKALGLFRTKKGSVMDDKELRIDCSSCDGPSLSNTACIRCIGQSIVRFGEPERIILRSGVEKEFSKETVELLRKISDAYCRTVVGRDDRRCKDCVLSRGSLEEEKWDEISIENIDEILSVLETTYVDCKQCQICISEASRYFGMLKDKLVNISEDAASLAYRIVGV